MEEGGEEKEVLSGFRTEQFPFQCQDLGRSTAGDEQIGIKHHVELGVYHYFL